MTVIGEDGVDGLTVSRLANRLGIKAPSLYKRFSGRDAILAEVERKVFAMLGAALERSRKEADPAMSLLAACRAHRAFAKKHVRLYPLLFSQTRLNDKEAQEVRYQAADSILKIFQDDKPDVALKKARTMTAFVHGFVSIEIASGFQMGGDVDAAFDFGAKAIVDSLA